MEHMFEIQRYMANLATLALLVGAVIALIRTISASTLLQVVGMSAVVVNVIVSYLMPMQYNATTRRLEPHWVLNLGYILTGGGYFIFAAGYLMERILKRQDRPNISFPAIQR